MMTTILRWRRFLRNLAKFASCMEVNRLRYLCIETYKSINNINPRFMKQIFQLRETNRTVRNQYKLNLSVPNVNHVSYGEKGLRFYGPKIWNSLPFHVKISEIS